MKSTQQHMTAGVAKRRFPMAGILNLALGAIFLLAVVHPHAWGQGGRGQGVPRPQGQNANGMHIYLWTGLKSHGVGQHDYPQFLADWSKLLTEHGAVVEGALHEPSAADLEHTDVVVVYKGDAAYLSDSEKAALEAYVKRGGGLVSFHDSLCGLDPDTVTRKENCGRQVLALAHAHPFRIHGPSRGLEEASAVRPDWNTPVPLPSVAQVVSRPETVPQWEMGRY